MSRARLIITAVVVEGRSQAQVARDYNVSKAWVSTLGPAQARVAQTPAEKVWMVVIGPGPFTPEPWFPVGELLASLPGENNHGVVIVGSCRTKCDGGAVHGYNV